MRNHILSLFLGLTATAVVSTPMSVQAATYNYSGVKNITARPIASNSILEFYGDQYQNEGFTIFSNVDPDAPDGGHFGIRINPIPVSYYAVGRERSPDISNATRTASSPKITGFSNFANYINNNNISPDSIGFGFSPKSDRDLTKTWNLGEDKLGQDWFSSPDSTIEEDFYRANPDDVETFLSYGETKIINFGYSPIYFISDNVGGTNDSNDNWNIILSDPVSAFKSPGLDTFNSELADAFLRDVVAGGGSVQLVTEDQSRDSDISFSVDDKYRMFTFSFPVEIRVVSSVSVPEYSSGLGLLMFGALVAVSRRTPQKQKHK